MEKDYIYRYGFLFSSKVDADDINLVRKCFLTALFPLSFINDVVEAINTSIPIDSEIPLLVDELFNSKSINLPKALSFIREFVEQKGILIESRELEEFRDYHKISKEEFTSIVLQPRIAYYNTPHKIKAYLDKHVIGQEEAKKTLSVSFYLHLIRLGLIESKYNKFHFNPADFPKPNILITGTTGSGKSYMINLLCNLFGLPFLKIDCSSLVSSGYVGNNLNSYFRSLIHHYGQEEAERAIVFFDEFDKVSEANIGRSGSVGGIEIQQEFLTILEDKQVMVRMNTDGDTKPHFLKTQKMLMVFAGSFAGIEKIIKKRINNGEGNLGFRKKPLIESDNILKKINFEDLISFGIIPELVGRIGFIAVLNTLTKEELVSIIKTSKDNELKKYENFFAFDGDKIHIHDEVYDLIAEEALKRKTGARALSSVILQLLNDLLYDSVNESEDIFEIDAAYFKSKI